MTVAEFNRKWSRYCRGVTVLVILLFVAAFIFVIKQNPYAPHFREITSFTTPSYTEIYYDFLAQRPFEGGQAWLTLIGGTNGTTIILFDLERRKVIGQLLNAQPAYFTLDRSKLLCSTRGPARPSLVVRCIAAVSSVLRRLSIPLPKYLPTGLSGGQFDNENYWVLDLNSNRAVLLG
jgi:hypothetical protein